MKSRLLKLTIDLVPESCWYANVRKRIPQSKWNKLRQEILSKADNTCEICGSKRKLVCHERWRYDDKRNIQKLKGFKAICRMCHSIKHFGMSQVLAQRGYLDLNAIIKHFCKVNGVSREVFIKHKEKAFAKWRERSGHKWKTDFGKWSKFITPKTTKGKNGVSP